MMKKVLLAFALKEELAPWRRHHRFRSMPDLPLPVSFTTIGSTEVYAALVGAGAPDARQFSELAASLAPSLVIVTGVAAGLKPGCRPGDLIVALSVSGLDRKVEFPANPDLVRLALECGAHPIERLMTLPQIVRLVEEKVGLGSIADAADMESLIVMKQISVLGIPSLALRVILDPVEMPMTCDFESAMDDHGQVRISNILAQLALHPSLLSDLLHLAKMSKHVLLILAGFLDCFIEQLDRQPAK